MAKNLTENIEIGGDGVKSILSKFKAEQAVAEFIWNGFDSDATEVNIEYDDSKDLGAIDFLRISDNGKGIPQDQLNKKFKPFYESEKAKNNKNSYHHSLTHGKNGIGRLTFFTFAKKATWTTVFENEGILKEYDIEIESSDIENYTGSNSNLRSSNNNFSGTSVEFSGIDRLTKHDIEGRIKTYLMQEFGWFLEIFADKGFNIRLNGEVFKYEEIVGERDSETFTFEPSSTEFNVEFIRWTTNLKNEFSKFYLLDSNGNEIWKDTTKLNKKGDSFYHSIYVKSDYFDNFTYDKKQHKGAKKLVGNSKEDDEYKFIEAEITDYLRRKRKPFLKIFAEQLVDQYEKDGVIPPVESEWDKPRNNELKNVIKSLYEVEPKIFSQSSIEQKKTFVRLLNAFLDTDEREKILKIIEEVVNLSDKEQEDLLEVLQSTKLNKVISTIKFIQDRFRVVDELKTIVFDKDLKANERDHVQKSIDSNYWLFGEKYHLLTSTEAKFDKALREYTKHLTGTDEIIEIDHEDKNKEMDIFMCRQSKEIDRIENVVLELKSPSVNLGEKEVNQVKQYMRVILRVDQFNAENMFWEFILVGNKFNTSGYIEGEIENSKNHGEKNKGLIYKADKYKIYVRKWSEIFNEFDIRHKYIEEKLELERDKLAKEYSSADEIIKKQKSRYE